MPQTPLSASLADKHNPIDAEGGEELNLRLIRPGNRQIKILVLGAFIMLVAVTGWRIAFQGIFEPVAFDVPHREAGAGDNGFLVQLALALATILMAMLWLIVGPGTKDRLTALGVIVAVSFLVAYTARGLQRFAPGYSGEGFMQLWLDFSDFRRRRVLTTAEVEGRLGRPLATNQLSNGTTVWLYSYMPSCGFGWNKRFVFFDPTGRVIDLNFMDEP